MTEELKDKLINWFLSLEEVEGKSCFVSKEFINTPFFSFKDLRDFYIIKQIKDAGNQRSEFKHSVKKRLAKELFVSEACIKDVHRLRKFEKWFT